VAKSDDTPSWLDCECEVCKQLDAVAHDAVAWRALLNERGLQCPVYARDRESCRVDSAIACNGDGGESEACERAVSLSPMSPEQLQLEGVEP